MTNIANSYEHRYGNPKQTFDIPLSTS